MIFRQHKSLQGFSDYKLDLIERAKALKMLNNP